MRGVSQEEIAAATRISTRFLEALETEQWDRLPGGVFNRGFVRAVARFLGLDEENLVSDYVLATSERSGVAIWSEEAVARKPARRLLALLIGLATLTVVSGGSWYSWHRYKSGRSAASSPQAATASSRPAPTAPSSPANAPTPPGGTSAPASIPPAPPGSSGFPTSGRLSASAPAALQLRVEAVKTAAVSVLADGKPAYESILAAGQSQTFLAQQEFRLSTSNAGALLLELNGQTLAPLGPPGHPGKITLTRQNLKPAAGGPN